MPKERDQFRKYVRDLKNRKWKCKFCGTEFAGSTPRIRAHLAGIPGYGIKACDKVDDPVRAEALETFNGKGSVFNICTGGTSGKGMERTVFGTSQSVLPSDGVSNPNDTQNSNQLGCVQQQQSFYRPTGTGTAPACPQDQVSLPPGDMPLDNLDTTQQPNLSNCRLDAAHGNENASSLQQLPMDSPASPFTEPAALLELPTHLKSGREQQNARGLSSFPNDQVLGNSRSSRLQESLGDGITPDPPLYSTGSSHLHHFLPENLVESRDDCGQPREVEVVPGRSNTSPTDALQHPGQLPPRCDKEDGNDIRRFPSRALTDIDPSIASQHTSVIDSPVPKASTNTIGPSSSHASMPPQRQIVPHQYINLKIAHQNPTVPSSSWKNHLVTCHPQALMHMDSCMPSSSLAPNNARPSPRILPCGTGQIRPSSLPELDMNEGAPMMSHPNTGNNFEESRDLQKKLKLLYEKKNDIRDELEYAALSLKKPRMQGVNWLANVEKLRNDWREAASEGCLPSYGGVHILMHEAGDLMRQDKGLFEATETKANKLLEEKMVGEAFQRNTKKILEYLEGNQISLLGIYGMGGVGKTTIMVHIYNRLLEEANYGNVLWITVSRDFNTQKLQDTIGKELGLDILQEKDVRKRASMLCNYLTERGKSIVILDEVWECFDLKEVGIPNRADRITLVLTTQSLEVCRQMQCQKMMKIELLSHKDAKSLFLEELKSEVANLETKAIVESIVKECAGLPLAVITMAKSMRGVTDVFEWKDCLKKLRDSDMGQTNMEKVVLKKLEVSYNCLGKHEVQQCFLSCALYPKDKLIDKFELIEFFIDQGLFDQLETREEQYVRGHTILNKLANVCLLEDHGSHMKMHNLIRDMALHVMSAISIVKAGKGLKRIPYEEYWTDALEKVSLIENDIREFPLNMSPNCPKLSTFLFNENWQCDLVIPDSFFKQLWGLKVLNLSRCDLRELPNSISDLVHLTVLSLGFCQELRCIPYLGNLRYLRKLDVFSCVKLEAIKGLEMLVNLRYLDIIDTSIEILPKGTLGALLNLQCLRARLVNGEEITKLRALETLQCFFDDVDDFNKFVRALSKQGNNPRYYNISVDLIGFTNFDATNVGFLFQDCERSVMTTSHANVSARGESSGSGSGICILIPQDVRNLVARNCDGATNLSDIGLLEKLEGLEIGFWSNLRVLCGGQGKEVIDIHDSPTPVLFRSLRNLSIRGCRKLKYLFGHEPKFSLPHLRRIEILYCVEIVGITVVATSPLPYPPPAFPSLEEIIVHRCNKMKRLVESEWLPHFPNLRRIEVHYCKNMEEIIGGLSSYMLVEEISPERLLVEGCHELPLHLRNLQTIQVIGCRGMVEMISGAGLGQEGSMTTLVNNTPSSSQSSISLSKLNSLFLRNLPQLKSICEVPITCNSMESLVVIGCPELNRIPLELKLRDIEDLPYIKVEGEEKWQTLIWDHPDAQANLQSHLLFMDSYCILKGRRNSQFYKSEGELSESEGSSESEGELFEREGELSESESESSDADFEEV